MSGIMLSHEAMEVLANATPLPSIFSELRVGTLLRAASIALQSLSVEKAMNLYWDESLVWPNPKIPGIYHPVKSVRSCGHSNL
jgi:hypothetical protein